MTRKTLLLIACLMGYAAAVFSQTLNRSAWMKGLSDEIPVCQLTIPATHDSGALLGGEALQTQDITIREQLEIGVRGFDIRLQACENGKLGVYHSVQFQEIYWETDVLPAFIEFLKKNPSEMLFVSLQEHAQKLAELLRGKNCMVNLIPWNAVDERDFASLSGNAVHRFQDTLIANGIHTRIRRERGTDIGSACGQLRLNNAKK